MLIREVFQGPGHDDHYGKSGTLGGWFSLYSGAAFAFGQAA